MEVMEETAVTEETEVTEKTETEIYLLPRNESGQFCLIINFLGNKL